MTRVSGKHSLLAGAAILACIVLLKGQGVVLLPWQTDDLQKNLIMIFVYFILREEKPL